MASNVTNSTNPAPIVWDFNKATTGINKMKPAIWSEKALRIIGDLGLILAGGLFLAGVISSAPSMTASIILLSISGAVAITAIALKFLAMIPAFVAKKQEAKLVEDGLTEAKRAELSAGLFKDLLSTDGWNHDATKKAVEDLCKVSPDFIAPRFNPTKHEPAQFSVQDKHLSLEKKIELLYAAYEKGTILHFNSLEGESWPQDDAGTWSENIKKPARESLNMSISFLGQCLASGDNLDINKVNQQLNALALKRQDGKALTPSLSVGEDSYTLEVGPQLSVYPEYLKNTLMQFRGSPLPLTINWRVAHGELDATVEAVKTYDNINIANPNDTTTLDAVSWQKDLQPRRWTATISDFFRDRKEKWEARKAQGAGS